MKTKIELAENFTFADVCTPNKIEIFYEIAFSFPSGYIYTDFQGLRNDLGLGPLIKG